MADKAGSNLQAIKEAAFKEAFEIGRSQGKGNTARLRLAERTVALAREGAIGVDDAEAMWTNMLQGSGAEMADVGGEDQKESQSTKQRISELKHFITLGSLKMLDGVEMLDNAKTRMRNLRSTGAATGRIWVLVLAFARAQNKSPERALTDQEIDRLMEDKSAEERETADILWGARNTLLKANEGNDFDDIYEAATLIEKRVGELGGTRLQKRKAAQAKAKAAKEEQEKKAKAKAKNIKRK